MIRKIIIFIFFILFNSFVYAADDVAGMASVSEAAGDSAQAAAEQLTSDAGKVTENIAGATAALGEAKSDIGQALDTSIAQAQSAMAFAQESLSKGDITAAVQTMSLVEGVADMALGAIPDPNALNMAGVDFAKDFSPEEMAALSSMAGQMGVGKVVAMQELAGQMSAVSQAGFDAKGMMGSLDSKGIGIGAAMEGLAQSGMVDMKAVVGKAGFDMGAFDPANFASMNIAEMGMSPSMMAGALGTLPIGAATAALETMAKNPGAMGDMSGMMTGAIAATMSSKGMGAEMMASMEKSIGVQGMAGMAEGMKGMAGMQEMAKAMGAMGGMEKMATTLSTAFGSAENGIAGTMSSSVGMISGAISGKQAKGQSVIAMGSSEGSPAAMMVEAGPTALEMPENISDSGMMMGAMVMAKSMMAGGLPGTMAPPKGMTAISLSEGTEGTAGLGGMMGEGMKGESMEAMSAMTGMSNEQMSEMGLDKMAETTGLTPGMMATMGSAGLSGMDITSVMSANVAGLGSKAVADLTAAAASGGMTGAMMGDMMQTGLVNQGTMAAMGAEGMTNLSGAMGMKGGDMGLAAMSGGITGMGKMDTSAMNPDMAKSMGLEAGPAVETTIRSEGTGEPMPGIEGAEGASMNLGQVSASMGTGADASKALGSAAEAAEAASEAGSGIAAAAAGAAAASQEAAAAMGVMTGMSMQEMDDMVGHEVAGMSMEAIAASEAAGAAAMAAAAAQIATENLSELVHDATVGQGSGAPGAGPAVDTSIQSQGTGEPMPGE